MLPPGAYALSHQDGPADQYTYVVPVFQPIGDADADEIARVAAFQKSYQRHRPMVRQETPADQGDAVALDQDNVDAKSQPVDEAAIPF